MAILGIGSTVAYSTDGGTTFTVVPEAQSINVPSGTHDTIDVVHLGITDNTKQFLIGLADPGELSFKFNYTATVYSALFAIKGLLKSGTNDIKWRCVGPDENGATTGGTQTWTTKGALISLDMELMTEEIAVVEAKVKLSGGTTLA